MFLPRNNIRWGILASLCFIAFLLAPVQGRGQQQPSFRVMFWNVENLFDIRHDTLKNDREFLPDSYRRWNYGRYKKKLADIAAGIVAAGEGEIPAIVGLCEVENDATMRDLTKRSPLKTLGYRYVMTESPDLRGIDVALLYQRHLFRLLSSHSIRIAPIGRHRPTRDLLHVCGQIATGDTLDIIVCHLPSRTGGAKASEPYRLHVAGKLRAVADSLLHARRCPQLIIMGDFNDHPTNASIKKVLNAQAPPLQESTGSISPQKLYHLLARKAKSRTFGSYKYRGKWELIDHLIVSGNLLTPTNRLFTTEQKANVFRIPFLLREDKKYGGDEPFRTYQGMKYQGGISDHLPVYVDFEFCNKK